MDREGQSNKEPVSHKQHWLQNIRFIILWGPELLIKFSSHDINSTYCNKIYFTSTVKFTIKGSDNIRPSTCWKI